MGMVHLLWGEDARPRKSKTMNLRVSREAEKRITLLTKASKAKSRSQLFRRALALLEVAVETVEAGGRLILQGADGVEKEVEVIYKED